MYFTKQKHETIFHWNYENLDNLKFMEALNRELIKHDDEVFHEFSILNRYAPLKKNYLTANHVTFVTKGF